MKRSGRLRQTPMPPRENPIQRRTRFEPGEKGLTPCPLRRRVGLTPGGPLPAVNKERQARKTAAAGMSKGDAQKAVRARSGNRCEFRFPGVCLGRATNFAHRKPEGQGGLYVPSNLVHSCGHGNSFPGCHRHQESNRTEAYEKGWLVRERDDHRKRPVWMWYRGEWGWWLLDDKGEAVPAPLGGKTPTTVPEKERV